MASGSIAVEDLRPVVQTIIVCAVWLGVTVPLLVLLFWTSNKQRRRKGIFIANAITLSFGVILGLLNIVLLFQSLMTPTTSVNRPAQLAYTCLVILTGELIDSVLIFRVVLVFPRSLTPRMVWWAVFGPLVALKLARLANIIIFMVIYSRKARGVTNSAELGTIAMSMPEAIVAWTLQIVDNSFCSFIFLYWLHKAQSLSSRVSGEDGRASFADRLRVLFWIAVSNYVFPVLFALALLIAFILVKNYQQTMLVMLTGIYVSIYGVLCATVWAQQHDEEAASSESSSKDNTLRTIHFATVGISTTLNTTSTSTAPESFYPTSEHSTMDGARIRSVHTKHDEGDLEGKASDIVEIKVSGPT